MLEHVWQCMAIKACLYIFFFSNHAVFAEAFSVFFIPKRRLNEKMQMPRFFFLFVGHLGQQLARSLGGPREHEPYIRLARGLYFTFETKYFCKKLTYLAHIHLFRSRFSSQTLLKRCTFFSSKMVSGVSHFIHLQTQTRACGQLGGVETATDRQTGRDINTS